jgi:tetratricopeptide (TPR) repeat protein
MKNDLTNLHQFVITYFSLDELRELCFELGVEYENLAGSETRQAKARSLLLLMGEQKRLDELLQAVRQARPEAGFSDDPEYIAALYKGLAAFREATKSFHEKLLQQLGLSQQLGFTFLAVLILGTTYIIYQLVHSVLTEPLPPMSKNINIAIAKFGVLDAQGRVGASNIGEALAGDVFEAVDEALEVLREDGFRIELRSPQEVGFIEGTNQDNLVEQMLMTADDHGADILIYGYLEIEASESRFVPQVFISSNRFRNAAELDGVHEVGARITVADNVRRNPAASQMLREQLALRTPALAQLAVGLGYFALDRFVEAQQHFEAAAVLAQASSSSGGNQVAALLHLFQGSTAAQQGNLPLALSYYETALDIDRRYARALVGAAQIHFLQARGQCQPGQPDIVGIDRAKENYTAALRSNAPAHANIPVKVALGMGHIYLCLSQALVDDNWDKAEQEYETVIASYDPWNIAIHYLVAEAHAGLGFIALPFEGETNPAGAYRQAVSHYGRALELTPHQDRQAVFATHIARIRLRLGECEEAEQALVRALEAIEAFEQSSRATRPDLATFLQETQAQWHSECAS